MGTDIHLYVEKRSRESKNKNWNVPELRGRFTSSLCTPLNSAYGFLFIQSYTESSIQDPVKNFITDLLKWEDDFYAVRIEPFVPNYYKLK